MISLKKSGRNYFSYMSNNHIKTCKPIKNYLLFIKVRELKVMRNNITEKTELVESDNSFLVFIFSPYLIWW